MNRLTISLIQMDCQLADPETNFQAASRYLAEAVTAGAHLAVLPELWHSAYALEAAPQFACSVAARPDAGGWFGRMAALAADHGIAVTGSLLENDQGHIYNTMVLYDAKGALQASYRKLHLVPMLDEPRFLAAGESLQDLQFLGHPTGLAVCYDLRFPEMFRQYTLQGCQLILLCAEWPHPRSMHWQTLLRSRAIENQCFVAACNRVGSSAGVSFCGHSAIIDPWGETLVDGGEVEGVFTASLDMDMVSDIRTRIPVLAGRRPEVYGDSGSGQRP